MSCWYCSALCSHQRRQEDRHNLLFWLSVNPEIKITSNWLITYGWPSSSRTVGIYRHGQRVPTLVDHCTIISYSSTHHINTLTITYNARSTLHSITSLHQRWSLHALCVLLLASAPFQRLLHRSGTVCRTRSGRLRRCKFSAADWKPNFLPGLTAVTNNVSLHWLLLHRTGLSWQS